MEKKIKVLNLYAGIGGNRKLWENVEVTAIEYDEEIAQIYQDNFPEDKVIIGDAHAYLLEHYDEFDFIWSSPPCPTHSRMRNLLQHANEKYESKYPDMQLYQEILLLKHFFKGKWVVENVISYYDPLVKPFMAGNHYFWSNFHIPNYKSVEREIRTKVHDNKWGFDLREYPLSTKKKDKLLNNMVHKNLGLHVFNCAWREKQKGIGDY